MAFSSVRRPRAAATSFAVAAVRAAPDCPPRMPKRDRLSHEELRHFKGKRLTGALFSLVFGPSPTGRLKMTVVVPKRVAGKAVQRSLIKRRARAAFTRVSAGTKPNLAFVLTARTGTADAPYRALEQDIYALIERASRERS
jgi:ribonuclease P protein component